LLKFTKKEIKMRIQRRKGSKIYYMYFIDKDGKRIRQSIGTINSTKIHKILNELKADIHYKAQ